MEEINEIVYDKFKIEVFSPDGTFIKNAIFNTEGVFYCPGLTPGQLYLIVFSYDDILLLLADFTCTENGKVIYLSPGHFVFSNDISMKAPKAGNELATKIKRRKEFKAPFQQWEKKIIENFINSHRGDESIQGMNARHPRFKAGAALAKCVK
ncbi:MAG: hypothetical protein V1904_06260 [Bacteroidota bacterium]